MHECADRGSTRFFFSLLRWSCVTGPSTGLDCLEYEPLLQQHLDVMTGYCCEEAISRLAKPNSWRRIVVVWWLSKCSLCQIVTWFCSCIQWCTKVYALNKLVKLRVLE